MPSVTLTKITKEESGRVLVAFSNGSTREFNDLAHMRMCVRAAISADDLIDIALALALSRQPSLGNPAALEGRTVTVNFSAANWGTVG